MSSIIQVRPGTAVLWTARDLMEGESFKLYYSPDAPSDKCAKFVPLVLGGIDAVLDEDTPMVITAIPGWYQAIPETPPLKASVSVSDPFPVTITWNAP